MRPFPLLDNNIPSVSGAPGIQTELTSVSYLVPVGYPTPPRVKVASRSRRPRKPTMSRPSAVTQ